MSLEITRGKNPQIVDEWGNSIIRLSSFADKDGVITHRVSFDPKGLAEVKAALEVYSIIKKQTLDE